MIDSPWFPLIYQYIIGGVVFTASIIIAIKKKALLLQFKRDKRILYQLIFGFLLYLGIHIFLTIISGA